MRKPSQPDPNPMKDKTILDDGSPQASPSNLDPSTDHLHHSTPPAGNKHPDHLAQSLDTPPTTLFPSDDSAADVIQDYVADHLGDIAPELSYSFASPLPPTPPSGSYSRQPLPPHHSVAPIDHSFASNVQHSPLDSQDDHITHVHSLVSSLLTMKDPPSYHPPSARQVPPSLDSSMLPPLSHDSPENIKTTATVGAHSFVSHPMLTQSPPPSYSPQVLDPAADEYHPVAPTDFLSSAAQIQEIPQLVSSIFPSGDTNDAISNVLTSVQANNELSSFQDVPSIETKLLSSVLPDIDSNPSELLSKGQSSSPPMEDASLLVSASALFNHPNFENKKESADTPTAIDAPPVGTSNTPLVSQVTCNENEPLTANVHVSHDVVKSSSQVGNTVPTNLRDEDEPEENTVSDGSVQLNQDEAIHNFNREPEIEDEISTPQMPLDGAIANPIENPLIQSTPQTHSPALAPSKEKEDVNLVASVLADFAIEESRHLPSEPTNMTVENKSVQFNFSDFMKDESKPEKDSLHCVGSSPLPPLTWSSPPLQKGDLTEKSVVSSLDALPGVGKSTVSTASENKNTAHRRTERLSFFTTIGKQYVNSGFNIAMISVAAWSLLAALIALISGHLGLAAGQALASGGSIYLLQKRKKGVAEVLERAHSTVSDPCLEQNELTEKTGELFSATLGQAFDTATTFIASIFTPISLAIPAMFIGLFEISGAVPTLLIHLGFGVLGLPFLAVSLAMYGKARKLAVDKAEEMLKPTIDAALLEESSEETPLLVSAV